MENVLNFKIVFASQKVFIQFSSEREREKWSKVGRDVEKKILINLRRLCFQCARRRH